ncbi:rod shape-determining protein MreD [Candidatus Methylomirabilis sp.]|uniref:Rod shape-determining protein MreD n=1 Tax=Candidatus Methylomirabilis tolerans TaxID=3123416 RepID=A0AAJ1AGJ1_9BACT|nr:rod shape-determining protein MreD [Candidatus Methylomirabilis sp.]
MIAFLLALFGVCLLQASIAPHVAIGGIQPDLFLILLLGLSLSVGPEPAAAAGFLIGLYQDSLSGAPLGLNAFALSLIGFLVSRLSRQVKTTHLAGRFALLCLAGLLSGLITVLLLHFFRAPRPLASALLWTALPGALYTATLGTGLLAIWPRQTTEHVNR